MSSKSRKQSGKGGSKKSRPGAPSGGRGPGASAPRGGGVLDIPDEYLRVPRKTSRLKFVLMIGLVVVLLIIFVVPTAT